MKATEQYFPVVLFIMLYKEILTFKSVDEILTCDHSNESYCTRYSSLGAIGCAVYHTCPIFINKLVFRKLAKTSLLRFFLMVSTAPKNFPHIYASRNPSSALICQYIYAVRSA